MIDKVCIIFKLIFRTIRIKVFGKGIVTRRGFVNISAGSHVYGKNKGEVDIGSGIMIASNSVVAAVGGTIHIGEKCYIGRNCSVISHQSIEIGDNVMFGPGVIVYDHDHIFNESGICDEGYNTAPIVIGKKCWIGANAIILRGSIIGEGCIIGAGTVIKGEIPAHSIVKSDRAIFIKSIENQDRVSV